jgi:hypothetical protein
MKLVTGTTWERVFDGWRKREGNDPAWIECAIKLKGWPDWESWRRFFASQINAAERKWRIFSFDDGMEEIPKMLVGPYAGWQSRHPDKNNFTFLDLLEIPEQYEFWRKHPKIRSIISNFPPMTEFIGMMREDVNKIVCLEGHHRATAVAVARKEGLNIDFSIKPRIALTVLTTEELSILDKVLKRGSFKNPDFQGRNN